MDTTLNRRNTAPPAGGDNAPAAQRGGLTVTITTRTIWITAAIALGAGFLVLAFTRAIDAFLLLFIAIILAEGIRPLVRFLGRLRVPRPLAVLLIYIMTLCVVGLIFWLLIQPVVSQLFAFANQLPQYTAQAQQTLQQAQQELNDNPGLARFLVQFQGQLSSAVGNVAPALITVPINIVSTIFDVVVVLTMTFFWLTSIDRLRPFVLSLMPAEQQPRVAGMLDELSRGIGGYLRGVLTNMLVIGGLTSIGLSLLQVPYALLLGVLAGLFEFIPFLGPWISGGVAVLVALLTVDPFKALQVFLLFQVVQQLEGNTVVPLVMSRAVKLNPLAVVVAVLVGGGLLGVEGAVLAVPMAAIIQIFVTRVLAPVARQVSAKVDAKIEDPAPVLPVVLVDPSAAPNSAALPVPPASPVTQPPTAGPSASEPPAPQRQTGEDTPPMAPPPPFPPDRPSQ